jgi:hypothetical protein
MDAGRGGQQAEDGAAEYRLFHRVRWLIAEGPILAAGMGAEPHPLARRAASCANRKIRCKACK